MKPHSQKFLQKRRFAMVLPVLVLPFLTTIFWTLGGGQGSPAQAMSSEKAEFNLILPDAHFNNEQLNKLAIYEKAERDSLKFKEERDNDPYFNLATLEDQSTQEIQQDPVKKNNRSSLKTVSGKQKQAIDPNEAKVNQKLEQLYRELNKAEEPIVDTKIKENSGKNISDPQFTSDVKQLEGMMEMMKQGNEADPEMQKINGMLEKILDVQHPDRVREKIKEQSKLKQGQVFPVEHFQPEENISLLAASKGVQQIVPDSSALMSKVFPVQSRQNSFYGLEDEMQDENEISNAIEAVIHDTQELVVGSTVKMRLMSDVYIKGRLIPRGQFIYGTCSITGERLTIAINSIRDENSLFPVSLSAYDLDGLEGLYIPGAITRDAAKQSSDQAMQSMQFMTMDQSVSAQAATAGIAAAKGLFSKKVKLIKVVVKAGYKVLLKDGNDKA